MDCEGERKVGDQVNLERAMGAHVRFGGHFVQVYIIALMHDGTKRHGSLNVIR